MEHLFDLSFSAGFQGMLIRFAISVIVNWIIVDRLYFKKSHRRDFYFTFIISSMAIFFIVFFMIFVLEDMKSKTSMGIGIGLFGIFSIMRYRTDAMPVREMTYLFVIIALSLVNAIAESVSLLELLFTNGIIVLAIWICESRLSFKPSKLIQYDRIELTKPDRRDELKADLKERLGLDVVKVEVGAVDMLRDMTMLRVYYEDGKRGASNSVDKKIKLRNDDLTQMTQ